jgi:hypothetical protein
MISTQKEWRYAAMCVGLNVMKFRHVQSCPRVYECSYPSKAMRPKRRMKSSSQNSMPSLCWMKSAHVHALREQTSGGSCAETFQYSSLPLATSKRTRALKCEQGSAAPHYDYRRLYVLRPTCTVRTALYPTIHLVAASPLAIGNGIA